MNQSAQSASIRDDSQLTCDLLVIGSGAAGLTAAVTAALLGFEVIVVEKDSRIGGTSAWSGGWLWIPNNPLARAAGAPNDGAAAREYLHNEIGPAYDDAMIEAFLRHGPCMVDFLQGKTAVRFINGATMADFHGGLPGAATGNRTIGAAPIDGRELGKSIRLLKPPLDQISPFGMGIATGEFWHFLNFLRKPQSFRHVVGRVVRHSLDRVLHGQGMHLVNGNALVARLLKSAIDRGVRIVPSAPAQSLLMNGRAVRGAVVRVGERAIEVRARRGVVLAAGGFPHDAQRRARMFAHAPTGNEHWSAAPPTNTGDGLRLGESAGGYVRTDLSSPGEWIPVSLAPRGDGTLAHFPHLGMDRAKPGIMMVRQSGERFCNEADSYHDVMNALFHATPAGEVPISWMICDHKALRRWGLGRVRPAPFLVGPWVRNGYLRRARTIDDLARLCGIDPGTLQRSIECFNEAARSGVDSEFHRGTTPFNRAYGDPECKPNPCLGPIESGPFYALRIVPGSLGTFAGLAADCNANVVDASGAPIPGLYVAGNDMSSIGGGTYPAGGLTLGPSMVFAFIAAHHACGASLGDAGMEGQGDGVTLQPAASGAGVRPESTASDS